MAGNNKRVDQIPEELQDFWDSHSLADYDELLHDVEFEVDIRQRRYLVALEPEPARKIAAQARGISMETLVNLWLSEKIQEIT